MKKPIQQEILLVNTTTFSQRQYCQKDDINDNQELSLTEQLEEVQNFAFINHIFILFWDFIKLQNLHVMKNSFLLFICACTLTIARAQVNIGIKGGVNLANMTGRESSYNKIVAYHGGVLFNIPVATNFRIQPEAVFSAQGAKYTNVVDEQYNLGYVNIPVLAKYRTYVGLFFEAGPQVGFLVKATQKVGDMKYTVQDNFTTVDFSFVFGAGYMTKADIGVDARFNLGLSNMWTDASLETIHNSVIQVGLFYIFPRSGK